MQSDRKAGVAAQNGGHTGILKLSTPLYLSNTQSDGYFPEKY